MCSKCDPLEIMYLLYVLFFFSSRRRHTRCALVTGVQTCALPISLYDTSGPYTDPEARIDIMAGLPELRRDWIRGRGDVEEVAQREVRPEDNGQLGPDRSGGVQAFPNVRRTVLRARAGANVTQMQIGRAHV